MPCEAQRGNETQLMRLSLTVLLIAIVQFFVAGRVMFFFRPNHHSHFKCRCICSVAIGSKAADVKIMNFLKVAAKGSLHSHYCFLRKLHQFITKWMFSYGRVSVLLMHLIASSICCCNNGSKFPLRKQKNMLPWKVLTHMRT